MELSGTVFLLITCNMFVTEFVYIINISVKTRSDSKLKHMQCCVNSAYYGFPLFYVCSADLLGWLVFHLCRLIFLIPRMTILNSASEGSSLRQCQKGFSTAKLALPIAYSGIKHIWGVLRIRHSLLLRSSLTYSLSPFLWLCESTSKLITKATRCLDVPDTSRRHCVPSLSETDGDRHWMILKTYPRCGTQWALLRHAFSRATWWSMTLMFLHYDFFNSSTVPQPHTPTPAPLYSLSSKPTRAIIYTPLIRIIPHFSRVKKKYSTNNGPKCVSLPLPTLLSFSLSFLFYSLVHVQHRTMQRRRTGWRLMTGLVTRWHTKGQVNKIPPPQWDMCHGPAMSPAFFVVSFLPSRALSPLRRSR